MSSKKLVKVAGFLLAVLISIELIYLAFQWVELNSLNSEQLPKSKFMESYTHSENIQWRPIQIPNTKRLLRPFIMAEDSRFYEHSGIDLEAMQMAMAINWKRKKWAYGASTISQQTVKNLLLSNEKSLVRKWHEMLLTFAMEASLSKHRILELYLNIVELGRGVFGVEAASNYYFSSSFKDLSDFQLASLAASLPSPRNHNPRTQTAFFQRHRDRILRRLKPNTSQASVSREEIEQIIDAKTDLIVVDIEEETSPEKPQIEVIELEELGDPELWLDQDNR